jgi:hypothetical protein
MKKILTLLLLSCLTVSYSQIQVHTVNVATNDLVFDSVTNKIYVTIPSSNGSNGNSIGIINPNTYVLENTVFMGSEPSVMAISDDGQFIYTGFTGAATIRKFNVSTRTAGIQFPLGSDSFLGPYYAEDIEVVPNQPNSIAVARKYLGVSPRFAAVAIYDDNVVRPTVANWYGSGQISNQIEFKNSSLLFGYDNETTAYSFNNLIVNSTGVSLISGNAISGGFMANANFVYGNNYCYFPNGMALDVSSTPFLSGTFPNVNGPVAYDIANNLVCFGINNSGNIVFKRFNANTFLSYDSLSITQAFGAVKKLISCGNGMYAMNTSDDKVVIIKDANLSNNNTVNRKNIAIYPNPVVDKLIIDTENQKIEKTTIYDMIGKKIIETNVFQNSLDLTFLETGMYIIELKDKSNSVFSYKFLKK